MVGAQIASRLIYPRSGPRRLVAAGWSGWPARCPDVADRGGTTCGGCDSSCSPWGCRWPRSSSRPRRPRSPPSPLADTGGASSLFNSQRQLGSALGVALVTTVIATVGATHLVAGHTWPTWPPITPPSWPPPAWPWRHRPRPDHQRRRRRRHHGPPRRPSRSGPAGRAGGGAGPGLLTGPTASAAAADQPSRAA